MASTAVAPRASATIAPSVTTTGANDPQGDRCRQGAGRPLDRLRLFAGGAPDHRHRPGLEVEPHHHRRGPRRARVARPTGAGSRTASRGDCRRRSPASPYSRYQQQGQFPRWSSRGSRIPRSDQRPVAAASAEGPPLSSRATFLAPPDHARQARRPSTGVQRRFVDQRAAPTGPVSDPFPSLGTPTPSASGDEQPGEHEHADPSVPSCATTQRSSARSAWAPPFGQRVPCQRPQRRITFALSTTTEPRRSLLRRHVLGLLRRSPSVHGTSEVPARSCRSAARARRGPRGDVHRDRAGGEDRRTSHLSYPSRGRRRRHATKPMGATGGVRSPPRSSRRLPVRGPVLQHLVLSHGLDVPACRAGRMPSVLRSRSMLASISIGSSP